MARIISDWSFIKLYKPQDGKCQDRVSSIGETLLVFKAFVEFPKTANQETFSTIYKAKLEKLVSNVVFSSSMRPSLSKQVYDPSFLTKAFMPKLAKQRTLQCGIKSPCVINSKTFVLQLIIVIRMAPFNSWHRSSICWFCWQKSMSRPCTNLKHQLPLFINKETINRSSHHELPRALSEAFPWKYSCALILCSTSHLHPSPKDLHLVAVIVTQTDFFSASKCTCRLK